MRLAPREFRSPTDVRLAARARAAAEDGIPLLTTHARAHTSGPILERAGFETVYGYRIFAG